MEEKSTKTLLIEEKTQMLTERVKTELDFTYTKFLLQYRIPFSLVKPLHVLTTEISNQYDSQVLEEYQISRNTATSVAKSISDTLKDFLYSKLSDSPFSLSMDASSDVNGHTYLAICAKYLDPENLETPSTKLLSIIPITTSSSGETLYKKIMDEILISQPIKENFIGIATDDGPNMSGNHKGLSGRLKKTFPYIIAIKDFSHCFNKIYEKALKAYPSEITNIVSDITKHFHYSTQRCSLLRDIQSKMNMKPLEILRMAETRWLTMKFQIERILEIWPALKEYFIEHGSKAEKEYFSADNEASLRTLALLVNSINQYNIFFQNQEIFYNEILDQLKEAFIMFGKYITQGLAGSYDFENLLTIPFEKTKDVEILKGEFCKEVEELLVSNEEFEKKFLLKYDSIKELIPKMSANKKEEIISASIKFYYICLRNMKKKLPFHLEILYLAQVVYFEGDFQAEKWMRFTELFPNILKTSKMRDEYVREVEKMEINYRKLKTKYFNAGNQSSYIKIWHNLKTFYPCMYEVARALFVLPHSSVPVERIFSTMKDIKTIKRNRLTTQSLEACLLGYQHFNTEQVEITDEMLNNYENYKVKVQKNKRRLKTSNSNITQTTKEVEEDKRDSEDSSNNLQQNEVLILEVREEERDIKAKILNEESQQLLLSNEKESYSEMSEGESDEDVYGIMRVTYNTNPNSLKRISGEILVPENMKKIKNGK